MGYALNEYEKLVNQKRYMEAEIARMEKMVVAIKVIERRIEGRDSMMNANITREEETLKNLQETKYEAKDLDERIKKIKESEEKINDLYNEMNCNREDRLIREFYH